MEIQTIPCFCYAIVLLLFSQNEIVGQTLTVFSSVCLFFCSSLFLPQVKGLALLVENHIKSLRHEYRQPLNFDYFLALTSVNTHKTGSNC